MLTRDSWVLVLIIIGAVAGYLVTLPPPVDWSWAQWMNCVVFVSGLIAAKLSGSGLAGANTPPKDTTTTLGGLLSVYRKRKEEP